MSELREQYERETGYTWENSQGEPDIDYVHWLEARPTPPDIMERAHRGESYVTDHYQHELLDCPHCGVKPHVREWSLENSNDQRVFAVVCTGCPTHTLHMFDLQYVIDQWNARTPPDIMKRVDGSALVAKWLSEDVPKGCNISLDALLRLKERIAALSVGLVIHKCRAALSDSPQEGGEAPTHQPTHCRHHMANVYVSDCPMLAGTRHKHGQKCPEEPCVITEQDTQKGEA